MMSGFLEVADLSKLRSKEVDEGSGSSASSSLSSHSHHSATGTSVGPSAAPGFDEPQLVEVHVRYKGRTEAFWVHREVGRHEFLDLLREVFELDPGSIIFRYRGAIVGVAALVSNGRDDPYSIEVSPKNRLGRHTVSRCFTVEDKIAVQQPGNKRYKNEQDVLRWGRANLKDLGEGVISLYHATRLCRHLRTFQIALHLNMGEVSLADPLFSKDGIYSFIRDAGAYLKSGRHSSKIEESRVSLLRQAATDPTGLLTPQRLLYQLLTELRRAGSAELVDDVEVALIASKMALAEGLA